MVLVYKVSSRDILVAACCKKVTKLSSFIPCLTAFIGARKMSVALNFLHITNELGEGIVKVYWMEYMSDSGRYVDR